MKSSVKRVEDLTVADLEAVPVWQFANDDANINETGVRPVTSKPLKNLSGRLVGTQVRLANGSKCWALIGNVDVTNPRLTRHFLTLSVFWAGHWFTMARYHDFDSDKRGPNALAAFLGLPLDQVFPISYDITQFCTGDAESLRGTIEKEPREKMTRAEIIALAVP